jgi:hypothetical protein
MTRRNFLGTSLGATLSAIIAARTGAPLFAQDATVKRKAKSCILLWMDGGPSQFETFDPKPGASTGGPTKAIDTAVDGIRISENLPLIAKKMKDLAVVRSVRSGEGSHWRAKYQAHTGYRPEEQLSIQHPNFGSRVCAEVWDDRKILPGFVSIGLSPFGAGYLGNKFNPYQVQNPAKAPEEFGLAKVDEKRLDRREEILRERMQHFAEMHGEGEPGKHRDSYGKALKLVRSKELREKLDISREPDSVRKLYGMQSRFAQSCLLARKLVQLGIPFIEVGLPGWDTHSGNFPRTRQLCRTLDPAWAGLVEDLRVQGLLDETLVVWMGEFGRTPDVNQSNGRDHYPNAWSAVLAGAGVQGGQVIGATDKRGIDITDREVPVHDLFASIAHTFGIDITKSGPGTVLINGFSGPNRNPRPLR